MGADGEVFDYQKFLRFRPAFVDLKRAKRGGVQSTVLLVKVSAKEVDLFNEYWALLKRKPGSFSIVGNNCSTHAASGFDRAGVISGEIPGLDTPDNLYDQICWKVRF